MIVEKISSSSHTGLSAYSTESNVLRFDKQYLVKFCRYCGNRDREQRRTISDKWDIINFVDELPTITKKSITNKIKEMVAEGEL